MNAVKDRKLEDLPPDIRYEIEQAAGRFGLSRWAVVSGGSVDVEETRARLTRKIDDLKARAEKMNERYREEMRYGDHSDPGFHERSLLGAAAHLERIRDLLDA